MVRSKLPLIGLPMKELCSVVLEERMWVMRSPTGEWLSTTVIRPGDHFVHNLGAGT